MIFAIDLGGTLLKSALVDKSYQIVEQFPAQPSTDNLGDCLDIIDHLVQPILEIIDGIALSCPGTVDTDSGVVYYGGMLRFLHEFDAKTYFENKYGKAFAVLNDGKAAVLAELATGNLQGQQNGLAMVLGTGLGGGLVINGQLYQGSHFQAGELTFMVPAQSQPIEDGNFAGQHVSAVSMIANCAQALGLEDKTDGPAVFDYIKRRDLRVYPIFQRYCRYLAAYIVNLQAVLDVERVVIGGGISGQEILLTELETQLDQLESEGGLVFAVVRRPEIMACKHRNGANLVGAAYFLHENKRLRSS